MSKASEAVSDMDLAESAIRGQDQHWELLTTEAMFVSNVVVHYVYDDDDDDDGFYILLYIYNSLKQTNILMINIYIYLLLSIIKKAVKVGHHVSGFLGISRCTVVSNTLFNKQNLYIFLLPYSYLSIYLSY